MISCYKTSALKNIGAYGAIVASAFVCSHASAQNAQPHVGPHAQAYITPYAAPQYNTVPRGEPLETMVARSLKAKTVNGLNRRGAGFYVDWQGHLLTASHVVLGCKTFSVSDSSGSKTDAILIGVDTTKDIAILRAAATLTEPFVVKDFIFKGATEVNAVASITSSGNANVSRSSIIGELSLGKSSVVRIVPALSSGVSGAPLVDDFGGVTGVIVGKFGTGETAESIATSGRDIIGFLAYHEISEAVPRAARGSLFGDDKNELPVWSEVRSAVVSIECKGT